MTAFTCSGASALQTVGGFFEVEIFLLLTLDYSYIKYCLYVSNDKKRCIYSILYCDRLKL